MLELQPARLDQRPTFGQSDSDMPAMRRHCKSSPRCCSQPASRLL